MSTSRRSWFVVLVGLLCVFLACLGLLHFLAPGANPYVLQINRAKNILFHLALIVVGALCVLFPASVATGVSQGLAGLGSSLKTQSRWRLLLGKVLVAGLITLLMVAIVEIVFGILNGMGGEKKVQEHDLVRGSLAKPDRYLGYRPAPLTEGTSTTKVGDEVVLRWRYTTDEFGRRVVPGSTTDKTAKFLAFFGCSMTFGEGVSDEETLPHFAACKSPSHKVYNYAVSGYGPQHMLARFQHSRLDQEIPEQEGYVIYVLFSGHVLRVIGSMSVYNGWGDTLPLPCYELDDQGGLVHRGTFQEARPLRSLAYRMLDKSQTLRYLRQPIDFPIRPRDRDLDLTTAVLVESQKWAKKTFPKAQFRVVFYPEYPKWFLALDPQYLSAMKAKLDAAGITYLDYSNLVDFTQPENSIPHDGHPSAKAHQTVAERVVKDLGLDR